MKIKFLYYINNLIFLFFTWFLVFSIYSIDVNESPRKKAKNKIIAFNNGVLFQRDEDPFLKAVNASNIAKVKEFVEQGLNINSIFILEEDDFDRSNYKTALIQAVHNHDLKMVNFLIGLGADIGLLNPLWEAIKLGDIEIINCLFKNNAYVNSDPEIILFYILSCAESNKTNIVVNLLIEHGTKINLDHFKEAITNNHHVALKKMCAVVDNKLIFDAFLQAVELNKVIISKLFLNIITPRTDLCDLIELCLEALDLAMNNEDLKMTKFLELKINEFKKNYENQLKKSIKESCFHIDPLVEIIKDYSINY